MKLCKDCKWFGKQIFTPPSLQYCNNFEVRQKAGDAIDGTIFASIARDFGPCYRIAKYWEKK